MTDITPQFNERITGGTSSKPLRILAQIISVLFHPVFMPVVMTLVLYKLDAVGFVAISPKQFNWWLISITITTLFFPLFTIFLLKQLRFIESIQLHTAKDRIIPLIAIMIYYFWINHVFGNIPDVPIVLHTLFLGCFWGIIAVFMITIFFKVSMHTASAGGMLGMLIVLLINNTVNMTVPLLAGIVIAGIIGTARLLLRAHSNSEIWLGYLIGILAQVGAYMYLKP